MERWQAAGQAWRAGAMLAALGGAVGLAGCLSATPTPPPQAAAPPVEVAPPPPAPEAVLPPHPLHKPGPPTIASLPAAPAETAPAAPPSASVTEPDFARLTGLDQDQTLAMLGQPQQRAESPPAVLWRYTSSACELDLYFYLDLQSRAMRVLHYELRDNDGSDRTGEKCYSELVSARRAD
jgi:hypothetical protein